MHKKVSLSHIASSAGAVSSEKAGRQDSLSSPPLRSPGLIGMAFLELQSQG